MKKLIILGLLMVLSVAAAPVIEWELAEATYINDILNQTGRPPVEAVLAPDGSALAWSERTEDSLCIYNFAEALKTCHVWPETYDRTGTTLSWSPDSQRLVFTEDFFIRLNESDIWAFEVTSAAFVNLTEDNELDSMIEPDFNGLLDYLPTWNPADGRLYFFRTRKVDDLYTLGLYHMNGQEAEEVRDLTNEFPVFGVIRPPAFSPDGTKLAISIAGRETNDPKNGLWIYDLASGELEQLVTMPDFYALFPAWDENRTGFYLENLQWAGNDGLVVFLYNGAYDATFGSINYYYVDRSTGDVQPLVDFSTVPDAASMFQADETGKTPITKLPRVGVVAPDGTAFLYLNFAEFGSEETFVSAMPLPPVPDGAQRIGILQDFQGMPTLTNPTVSKDGLAYMFGYLLKFQK